MRLFQFVATFLKREDGPTAVEYAVMLALIVTVCASSITAFGSVVNGNFKKAVNVTTVGS